MTNREVFFEKDEVFFVFSGEKLDNWEVRFYNPYGDSVTLSEHSTQEEAYEKVNALQSIFDDWINYEETKSTTENVEDRAASA